MKQEKMVKDVLCEECGWDFDCPASELRIAAECMRERYLASTVCPICGAHVIIKEKLNSNITFFREMKIKVERLKQERKNKDMVGEEENPNE